MDQLTNLWNQVASQAVNLGAQAAQNAINPNQAATTANNQIQAQAVTDSLTLNTKIMIGAGVGLVLLIVAALAFRK